MENQQNQEIQLKKGYIYKIVPNIPHDANDIYIGSSVNNIQTRLYSHKSLYKRFKLNYGNSVTSFGLFDKYGVDNCDVVLLEEFEYNNDDELKKREGYYIKSNRCINHNVAGRTLKEYCKDYGYKLNNRAKLWYKSHIDICKEKFNCNCGGKYTNSQKSTHFKSQRHKAYVENQNNEEHLIIPLII